MDFSSAEAKIAVLQFIELLTIISILCISFVIILLLYLKKMKKTGSLKKRTRKNLRGQMQSFRLRKRSERGSAEICMTL